MREIFLFDALYVAVLHECVPFYSIGYFKPI